MSKKKIENQYSQVVVFRLKRPWRNRPHCRDCDSICKMGRWLPNFEEFFLLLGRLIETWQEEFNSLSCDSTEVLVRWLDKYKCTLSTLKAHFSEACAQENSQQNCIGQLNHLLNQASALRVFFQWRAIQEENGGQLKGEGGAILFHEQSDYPGRQHSAIGGEQLDTPHQGCGFSWPI